MRASAALACVLALSGCSWESNGTRKHLVLGLGIVETASTKFEAGVPAEGSACPSPAPQAWKTVGLAERVSAYGVLLGPGEIVNGLMIGAASRQSVIIDPDAQLLMEAVTHDDGRFIVNISPVRAIASEGEQE